MATAVRTGGAQVAPVLSVMLPVSGGLVDVLASHGQSYIRDVQKELVPRCIAVSGYRWHNSVARPEMIQQLRYLTIRKGGVYVHFDALNARSPPTSDVRALAKKVSQSHAHAARSHQDFVKDAVSKLFEATPEDKKLCFVKEEVFGISDGGPIIGADHPVMAEMLAQPIIGVLFSSIFVSCFVLSKDALITALGSQVISNRKFCSRSRNPKGRGIQRRSRTGRIQASKSSSIFSVRGYCMCCGSCAPACAVRKIVSVFMR